MRSSLPFLLLVLFLPLLVACSQAIEKPSVAPLKPLMADTVDRSVDLLIMNEGAETVQAHCGACHSLALVTQNRMTRQGWISTIRWMQEKQGLWDLGEAETIIVDYLERNYGIASGRLRRKPLEVPQQTIGVRAKTPKEST